MTGEEIAFALGDLPEDLILGAMESGKRVKKIHVGWKRLIACAAVAILVAGILLWSAIQSPNIVEAEGILTIYACADDGITTQHLEKGIKLPWNYNWSIAINAVPGLPLRLTLPEEYFPDAEISFDISVTDGWIFTQDMGEYVPQQTGSLLPPIPFPYPEDSPRVQSLTLENGSQFYWVNITDTELFQGDHAYVDIIIYADEHIVGYAVVDIYKVLPDGISYSACILTSLSFPKLNDQFQNVSLSQAMAAASAFHDQE